MSGSILGKDQVARIDTAYPAIVAHVRALLSADRTPTGLMRVHALVEALDSDGLYKIFRDLSFISPVEKRALVRAAIFEVAVVQGQDFKSVEVESHKPTPAEVAAKAENGPVVAKSFTPPQFSLNVNKASAVHGQKPADTPPPAPVVTSTHRSTVAAKVAEANVSMKAEAERLGTAFRDVQSTPAEDVK